MEKENRKVRFLVLALMAIFVLSACSIIVQSQNLPEQENEGSNLEEDITLSTLENEEESLESDQEIDTGGQDWSSDVLTHADARDIVIGSLLNRFPLDTPSEWASEELTPIGLMGSSAYRYTSGAWTVTVSTPGDSSQPREYTLLVEHVSSGMKWTGVVDADRQMIETSLSEPLPVLSVSDALEAIVGYIVETYNWDQPGEWQEVDVQPTENAGVKHTFSSNAWVVQVEFLAAAPIVPEYHVIADHMTNVARFIGTINADGSIIVEDYLLE